MADKKQEGTDRPSVEDFSKECQEALLPQIDFATFIVSLNAAALVHMGAIEDPSSGQKTKNLPLGKQTIDTLTMLEEKTKGNRTEEEDSLLRSILYDLRMIYVREKGC